MNRFVVAVASPKPVIGLLFAGAVGLVVACAGSATPPAASPTPPASVTATTPAQATKEAVALGYLEGRASIGPLVPVERVGVPTPTPSAAICTARGLTIFRADGKTEVVSFDLQPDCTYRVALPPGTYVVAFKQRQGIGGSKDLPKTIVIESGRTVRLDVSIDTGIR